MSRALLLSLWLLPALARAGGDRELFWRSLDVEARLDDRGTLHVVERQVMVFTGDWNGGERRFRVEPGQALRFESLARLDGAGRAVPLVEGDLDEVDRYRFTDATTLRWRTRRPDDPPYRAAELTFVLRYALERVVVAEEGGGYRLAHDFAFPDRDGPIEAVKVTLALDPAWRTSLDPLALEDRDLPPGAGAVLHVPLRYAGAGAPDAWTPPPPPVPPPAFEARWRLPLLLFAAALLAGALGWVRRDATARGLDAPLPGPVDGAFLAEHVWAFPPEVIGAAWDDAVGSPEVSAVLARMTAEGKLEVRVTSQLAGLVRTVHLKLKVPRASLAHHERALVEGLFPKGDETDSNVIRAHHRKRGFDPSTRISGDLRARVAQWYAREGKALPAGPGERAPRAPGIAAVLLLLAGLGLAAAGLVVNEHPAFVVPPALLALPLALVSLGFAHRVGKAVDGRGAALLGTGLPLVAWLGGIGFLAGGPELEGATPGLLAIGAQAVLWCAAVVAAAGAARSRLSAGQIAVRRRLAAARRHLAAELDRPQPALRDDAVPYLLALGLGRGLDRWLKVHGPSSPAIRPGFPGAAAGTGALGGSGGGTPGGWTGGGGAFSGAGASGTWSALSSVASGVPAPSSSSGGSRSSGSSSSGGGGGGGW